MKNNNNILYFVLLVLLLLFIFDQNDTYEINIYKLINTSNTNDNTSEDEPKRHYDSRYTSRDRMRINVPTRGEPPSYQQVGILTDTINPENIKPLYGRQTYRGSNHWNYFTSLDSHLATKIPIYLSNKDCTDEYGCSEIYKDEIVTIGDPGTSYKVTIYNTYAPRYIPY